MALYWPSTKGRRIICTSQNFDLDGKYEPQVQEFPPRSWKPTHRACNIPGRLGLNHNPQSMADFLAKESLFWRIAQRKLDNVAPVGKDSHQALAPASPPMLASCHLAFSSSLVSCYYGSPAFVVFRSPLAVAEGWHAHLGSDKTHALFFAFCGIFVEGLQGRGSSRRCWKWLALRLCFQCWYRRPARSSHRYLHRLDQGSRRGC